MIHPLSCVVELPGLSVVCRELTLSEIRNWLLEYSKRSSDVVDDLLLEECRVSDLLFLTDIKQSDLDTLTPTQMEVLLQKAKEVNSRFFVMREWLIKAVQGILSPTPSNSQPAL